MFTQFHEEAMQYILRHLFQVIFMNLCIHKLNNDSDDLKAPHDRNLVSSMPAQVLRLHNASVIVKVVIISVCNLQQYTWM